MEEGQPKSAGLLEVSGLTLSRGGRVLLSNIGFTLASGEKLLVRGPNGAGKSSLLLALAGVLRPEAGRIAWHLGETPQIHYFGHATALRPHLTLAETLNFWRAVNGAGEMPAGPALEAVGLGGLEAIEAGHLSAGQGKRLALSRLLVSPRRVWLLDEPTASLDVEGHARVAGLIDAHTASGGIAIVATHDELALAGAPRTLALGAGR